MPKGYERTEQEALALIEPILDYLAIGMSIQKSCDAAGFNRETLYHYMKRFETVSTKVKKAKAAYLVEAHKTLKKAAGEDWKPALEVVKRKDKLEWSDQQNIDLTSGGDKINIISHVPRPEANGE